MAQAEYWTFPTNPEEFDQDERISFSKLDNKYIAVQDDGTEYEFDEGLRRWIPIVDEALIEEQQKGYIMPDPDSREGKKRKLDSNDREQDSSNNHYNNNNNNHHRARPAKAARRQANRGPPQPKQNTAVYVTGLPLDATAEEVAELFSRKCGVIAEEIDSGRPRIKMYTDENGKFKGDALVVFFKPESVNMAIMLLDDTDFRFPAPGAPSDGPKMRVQAADSSYKKTRYDGGGSGSTAGSTGESGAGLSTSDQRNGGGGGGSSSSNNDNHNHNINTNNNNNNNNNQQRSSQDKAKIIKKTQKLSAKLADWSDDDGGGHHPSSAVPPKHQRVVILRNMFTLDELREDPAALLDIKEDVREECAKLGPVTNVVLYDEEEDGIVSVKFRTREAAEACLRLMHGRAFAGRIVEAYLATGRERFRKSKADRGGGKGSGGDASDQE
ncbi:hypothetical protein VTH06DRAFT_561 [Thermothelomyces fergusii]